MNNIYLISSDDNFLINEEVNKIIDKNKDADIIKYSMKETLIDDAIESLDTYNFFSSKKLVIIYDAYFLTNEIVKDKLNHDLDRFKKYIENPNPDNILVIVTSKLDERKTICKLLKSKAKIIEGNINIIDILKSKLDGYKVDIKTFNYLVEFCNNDYFKIVNEFEKLKLFKYDKKEITISDIDSFVTKSIDDNIFSLTDAIVNKDKKKAFEIYEDLILKNEEPIKILVAVANKFRLLYQVKVLSKTTSSNDDIANIIGSHPYPVKLARGIVNRYSENDLLKIIYKLSKLDVDLKKGNIYQNIGFEMLILSL